MASMISSSCTTPNLSRTSTWSDDSNDSNASTSGLYTPADLSRQPSTAGIVGKYDGPQRMLVSSQSLLNLHELEDSLNVLDVNPSLRGNVKSAIKRAGTIVKNKFKRRPSVVQQSVDEPATFPQGEPTEKESLADALTPRPTPDIPSICVQDLGEISPNPELGTTPRLGTSQRSLTPNHAIMHSAYPYLLNPYDNANISATSLLAVCGSPAPAFQEHNNNNTTLHPTSGSWAHYLSMPIQALCLIPWCALVGACIILSPTSIEKITPSTANILAQSLPVHGPRRFAHWGHCAYYHVVIFVFPLVMMMLWDLKVAVTLMAGVGAKGWWEWKDFVGEMRSVGGRGGGGEGGGEGRGGPVVLGRSDMESVYLVLSGDYLREGYRMVVDGRVVTMHDASKDFRTYEEEGEI